MIRPFRLGLTGSIGMGKSTTALLLAEEGAAVWDADAAVHRLYAAGGAGLPEIQKLAPDATENGAVSRDRLKAALVKQPGLLAQIEAVIHPMVAADRARFLAETVSDIAVFDIPLLFEKGTESEMDATLLVTAPPDLQRVRVLARPGMSEAQFATILARQMPDREKRARTTHIVETLSLDSTRAYIRALVAHIRSHHA